MRIKIVLIGYLWFLGFSLNGWAASVRVENVEAELVSEVKSIKPGAPFWVALRLRMDDGWHTYWRNPGDSGLETQVTWNLPKGFQASELEWPTPEKLEVASMITFGYHGEVFLLAKMDPPNALEIGSESILSANVIWLSCADICIPGQAQLDLKLPVSDDLAKLDERWAHDFAKTRTQLPKTISQLIFNTSKRGKKIILSVTGKNLVIPEKAAFFPYEEGMFNLSAPQKISKIKNGFKLEILISKSYLKPIVEVKGILVAGKEWQGVEAKSVEIRAPIVK